GFPEFPDLLGIRLQSFVTVIRVCNRLGRNPGVRKINQWLSRHRERRHGVTVRERVVIENDQEEKCADQNAGEPWQCVSHQLPSASRTSAVTSSMRPTGPESLSRPSSMARVRSLILPCIDANSRVPARRRPLRLPPSSGSGCRFAYSVPRAGKCRVHSTTLPVALPVPEILLATPTTTSLRFRILNSSACASPSTATSGHSRLAGMTSLPAPPRTIRSSGRFT